MLNVTRHGGRQQAAISIQRGPEIVRNSLETNSFHWSVAVIPPSVEINLPKLRVPEQ